MWTIVAAIYDTIASFIPSIVVLGVAWLGWRIYDRHKPYLTALREWQKTDLLVSESSNLNAEQHRARLDASTLPEPLRRPILDMFTALYERESVRPQMPPVPDSAMKPQELENMRENLRRIRQWVPRGTSIEQAHLDAFGEVVAYIARIVPPLPQRAAMTVRLGDLIDITDCVQTIGGILEKYEFKGAFFAEVQDYVARRAHVTRKVSEWRYEHDDYMQPNEYDGDPLMFLSGNPLRALFELQVPFVIPEATRFMHGYIIADSGLGKSQLLEAMILEDLDQPDPPSIVLLDSKRDMVERIRRLDCFHPSAGRLRDRLIVIDPRTEPQLNLFDIDIDRFPDRASDIIDTMRFFFSGFFGNALSSQMNVLFVPLMHVALRTHGGNLHTLIDLIDNPIRDGVILDRVPFGPRDFLLRRYGYGKNDPYTATKTAIATRIQEIINETKLDAMFSAKRSSLNLGDAMNEGKVVLISTDQDYLGRTAYPIFGRYFISRIVSGALARTLIPQHERKPVHVYVDEAEHYMDERVNTMLTQMRSYSVGAMLAFQFLSQMGEQQRSIRGSAIRFAARIPPEEGRGLARELHTTPEFLEAQKPERPNRPHYVRFACYADGVTDRAVSATVATGQVDRRMVQAPVEPPREVPPLQRSAEIRAADDGEPWSSCLR